MKKGKTVFVSGNFNVIHPGHLRLLRFAKECGDRLVVGVASDRLAGHAAHVPEQLRLDCVKSNSWVDEAFIMDRPVTEVLEELKPDIVVKGKEHEAKHNPELEVLKRYNGRLIFCSGETVFSSLDLIRREIYEPTLKTIRLPIEYMERNNITKGRLRELLDGFGELKVCVIGDVIVDEYITCQPLGMSQEEPSIVVTPVDTVKFVGGAGIVAAHAAKLGAQVTFCTVTGADAVRDFVQKKLEDFGVSACLLEDENRPTTLKQRFRCKGKSLLRVSYLHQHAIAREIQDMIVSKMASELQRTDLLVFSDFNYGCLPQDLVDRLISMARKHRCIMVADSQTSSQVGDVSRYQGMDLLTPTEMEARISTRNRESGLVILAEALRRQAKARNIILKLGEEGILVHASTEGQDGWLNDRIDALNTAPRDVAGAGDSLLIVSGMTLASGGNIWEAACLGSLAAAIQVGRMGNVPITSEELLSELE